MVNIDGKFYLLTTCSNMVSFRETREALLYAYSDDLIFTEGFVLLYDTSKNRDFEYGQYEKFNLENISSEDDCIAEFRF